MPTPRLDDAAIAALPQALPDWRYDAQRGGTISRRYAFATFADAFAFMTRLAFEAERRDHHPEWSNVYNRVDITMTTHDAGGLSAKDVDFARAADATYAAAAAPSPR